MENTIKDNTDTTIINNAINDITCTKLFIVNYSFYNLFIMIEIL